MPKDKDITSPQAEENSSSQQESASSEHEAAAQSEAAASQEESSSSHGPCRIVIEGDMTIFEASALKDKLLQPLAECVEVEVDLAEVGEMDTAGLQLLLLAKHEANNRNATLRFTGHSQAVLEVLDLCNLIGHFGDPVLLHSHP